MHLHVFLVNTLTDLRSSRCRCRVMVQLWTTSVRMSATSSSATPRTRMTNVGGYPLSDRKPLHNVESLAVAGGRSR